MATGFGRRRWSVVPLRVPVRRVAALRAAAGLGVSIVFASGAGAASATDAGSAVAVRPAARWAWPVSPPVIERAFEAPQSVYAAGHRGIDLGTPSGTAVTAPGRATVRFVGVVVDRPVLTLDHGGGVLSSYEPLLPHVEAGDAVVAGQQLGVTATGGHCADVCLHVGVRLHGDYVSPLLFFDRVPRAILLPLARPAE